jgi:hypothetical protein
MNADKTSDAYLRLSAFIGGHYSFLNATTAKGGSVTAMECGRWCLGMGRDDTQPPLPMLLPPNNSESVFKISW